MFYLVELFFALSLCQIQLYQDYENFEQIQFQVANFGHILYGQTIIGELHYQETDGCQRKKISKNYSSVYKNFVLQRRGNCLYSNFIRFTKKIANLQKQNIDLAIIMDSIEQENFHMQSIQDADRITIPSILISSSDGKRLMQKIKQQQGFIIIKVTFLVIKSHKPQVMLFLNLNFRNSSLLVRQLKNYLPNIIKKIDLSVHYFAQKCIYCHKQNCYASGQYCVPDPDGDRPGTGRDILGQTLRQSFLFQYYPVKWFDYVDLFDKNCPRFQASKICSNNIMKNKMDLSEKEITQLNTRINQSFLGGKFNQDKPNDKLDNQRYYFQKYNIALQKTPLLMVNGMHYYGDIKASFMMEFICSSFNKMISQCNEIIKENNQQTGKQLAIVKLIITIIIIVAIVAVIFLIALCISNRYYKYQLKYQINPKVNQIVGQYAQLHSSRN